MHVCIYICMDYTCVCVYFQLNYSGPCYNRDHPLAWTSALMIIGYILEWHKQSGLGGGGVL